MKQSIFFDDSDRVMRSMLNSVIDDGEAGSEDVAVTSEMHPHGILNLTNTREYRLARAVIHLIGTLSSQKDNPQARLIALRALHDEVLNSASTTFRNNTGRVLLQIMKDIHRSRGNAELELRLIHDFRQAATGNPRIVRRFLERYYLLEMPEEWNQKTFDEHVHDCNTQGRKNSTHLIMDAWIKGIRRLTVVYYNDVDPGVARELLEAASIMGITVRIAIKVHAVFRGRYVSFLWGPRGFFGADDFVEFLESPQMAEFSRAGREVDAWVQKQVLATLVSFNRNHAPAIAKEFRIAEPHLDADEFLAFIGKGKASLLQLAEYAHRTLVPELRRRAEILMAERKESPIESHPQFDAQLNAINHLSSAVIHERWIRSHANPDVPSIETPSDTDDRPGLLRLSIAKLTEKLESLHVGYRFTLMVGNTDATDVVEILWDCGGTVTHIEIINLKDWDNQSIDKIKSINEIAVAINRGRVLEVKHRLREMIDRIPEDDTERREKFMTILGGIPALIDPYKKKPLDSRIGTNSTGHLGTRYGMGLAVPDTLAPGVRKFLSGRGSFKPETLPIFVPLSVTETYTDVNMGSKFCQWFHRIPGFDKLGGRKKREWEMSYQHMVIRPGHGNIITLGGAIAEPGNLAGSSADTTAAAGTAQEETRSKMPSGGTDYLNTGVSNLLKVLVGFVPAFATFMFTQDWWLLAWFGALIWFGITGLRNVIQSVLAGGLQRNTLLSWKQFVNWSRVCDSLMFTGISVVIIEGIMRAFVLGHVCNLTVSDHPLLVFSVIALTNGIYLSSHNIWRGFPTIAVVGNLFRSVLAIPVSMIYNMTFAAVLPFITTMDTAAILVPSAAIVSKLASDSVAAVIESIADRRNNYRLRRLDYNMMIASTLDTFTRLEIMFPQHDMLEMLHDPAQFVKFTGEHAPALQVECFVKALDLMYFWYYQPCSHQVLETRMRKLSSQECAIYARLQRILKNYKEVSRLFLEGSFGDNFSRALSFYLDNFEDYIRTTDKICAGFISDARKKKRIW